MIIKAYNSMGSNILTLAECFPEYNTHSYFKFGTNTNQFTELKIFN